MILFKFKIVLLVIEYFTYFEGKIFRIKIIIYYFIVGILDRILWHSSRPFYVFLAEIDSIFFFFRIESRIGLVWYEDLV